MLSISIVKSDQLLRFGILAALAVLVLLDVDNIEGQISSVGMQQVWASPVPQLVREPPGWREIEHHETVAVAFSPDDQRLVVTLTHNEFISGAETRFNTHLLVIEVQSSGTNVHQFDLSETCGADLAWKDSGNALLVCGTLFRIADSTSCNAVVVSSKVRRSSAFK